MLVIKLAGNTKYNINFIEKIKTAFKYQNVIIFIVRKTKYLKMSFKRKIHKTTDQLKGESKDHVSEDLLPLSNFFFKQLPKQT